MLKQRLRNIIHELHEIDDELDNEICLVSPEDDEDCPITEFTFWGVATMLENYLEEMEKGA